MRNRHRAGIPTGRAWALTLAAAGLIALGAGAAPASDLAHALDLLQQARQELKSSQHDKGGHRKRAIQRIDDAVTAIKEEQGQHGELRQERRDRHKTGDTQQDQGRHKSHKKNAQ